MVADTFHVQSSQPVRASGTLFGQDIDIQLPSSFIAMTLLAHLIGFTIFGTLLAFRYAYSVIRLLLEISVIPGTNVKTFQSRAGGTYAMVTGATSGIGLEFARQLAAKKFNIILVGRRESALEEVAAEIRSKYQVDVKYVTVDVGNPEARPAAFAKVESLAKEVDLGVLVNNVGASGDIPTPFGEVDHAEMDSILQTNLLWTLHLTRILLPSLTARKTQSLVLNIGSLNGRIPPPLSATYGCTKGGLITWSRALAEEVKAQGVTVYMVLPAFVTTKMSKITRTSLFIPSASDWVASALSSIGLPRGAQGRAHEMTPYWSHALQDYAIGFFGYFSEKLGMDIVHNIGRDTRKRALAKRAREAGRGKVE